MIKLSEEQEQKVDKELIAIAADYATILQLAIKNALASENLLGRHNNLHHEENEEQITTTFFYDKCVYIRSGILEMIERVTEQSNIQNYEGFSEHLETFEQYVNENLKEGWIFSYGENDDAIATKMEDTDS